MRRPDPRNGGAGLERKRAGAKAATLFALTPNDAWDHEEWGRVCFSGVAAKEFTPSPCNMGERLCVAEGCLESLPG